MVCFSLLGTLQTGLVLGAPLPCPFCWQTRFWTPLKVKLSPLLGFFQAVLPHPRPEMLPLWVSWKSALSSVCGLISSVFWSHRQGGTNHHPILVLEAGSRH